MNEQIFSVMTRDPICVQPGTTLAVTAKIMQQQNIGNVIVMDDEQVKAIVTDRDLVIRGVAEGVSPEMPVGTLATSSPIYLTTESSTAEAVRMMRDNGIRRLPVCDIAGRPVGIVSLGDLAENLDSSALAALSAANSTT